jgi:hypothetical protein
MQSRQKLCAQVRLVVGSTKGMLKGCSERVVPVEVREGDSPAYTAKQVGVRGVSVDIRVRGFE